ncbi:putative disease resistance protein RGA3 [Vicia villosa]|uniref:putative disease resistance protein RGA3 n=1 Tax=Vicia villosa TaxID=3911 RepID=UPI00273C8914|nr:putative disease resistance protein RGA3 [Vicia villosa]
MAESFLFDIANSLLGKLASYAYQEASRACGVYKDLQKFKDTLSIVKGLLLDAEYKKDQKHGLREWMRQIQNICSDAEDVFDGFEFQHKRKQVVRVSNSTRTKVCHFLSSSNPIVLHHRMARQIKEIRERLDKVAADGNKFGLARIDVGPEPIFQRRELTHSHVDASSVIGRESDKEEIIKLLMQPRPHGEGDKSLCIIPIVGIGGLGKTTLAKLVFNDKRMGELFQLKMWACISDDFDIRQIIIKIINSVFAFGPQSIAHQENISNLDTEQLLSRLRHKLSGQKFLLVLDDIWNDDRAKWIELIDLINIGAAGSQIIVTTRSKSIAKMTGTLPPYVLSGLSQDDCLSLFVKWAFKEGEEIKYPGLVEIGKEIVKKCAGVPLAVRTLGSSLFSKYDSKKWISLRDCEIWNFEQKKDDILPALKLSYDQMPSYLRQCFAYFSLYPKDHVIFVDDITRIWIALGLVQSQNGSEKLMDIAREYIEELNSRSFLQDFKQLGYLAFKVHDLIHDLAIYVAKEECVAVDSHTRNIPHHVRHLSVVENNSTDKALLSNSRSLRTILFPVKGVSFDSETLLDTWISKYKYLRYLDLNCFSFETLPCSIAKLEHLRVLDFSYNTNIKRLPHSICKLHNLHVLKLMGCTGLETLPQGLDWLISLRELYITTKQSVVSLTELANLNDLQVLYFYKCDNMKFLFSEAQQFTFLERLIVRSCGSLESLPLFIFPKLQYLAISDCQWINLSLYNESPIPKLMMMKHLYIGILAGLLTIPSWIEGVVETLETLYIFDLPDLTTLPECLTTMTRLKRLWISRCPQLLSLPSDFHHLTSLENLFIYGCPKLFQKYQPESGEHWPMIVGMKITSVTIEKGTMKE